MYLEPYGTRWVGLSGKGLSLDQLLNEPTFNGLYIQNVGDNYEPIIFEKSSIFIATVEIGFILLFLFQINNHLYGK